MAQQAGPRSVEMEILIGQALELRKGGATYAEIARTLHISTSTAHGYVASGLEEVREANGALAGAVRDLQLHRLDAMLLSLWPNRKTPRTADTILRLMERQAKLTGADAPTRWEGSGPGGGPIPVANAEVDVSKLTTDELRQLEAIHVAAASRALPSGDGLVPGVPALNPGVTVVPNEPRPG